MRGLYMLANPNDLRWVDALYSSAKRGLLHPDKPAITTGFYHMANGQTAREYVALDVVTYLQPRGAFWLVLEKPKGWRWFE